MSISKKHKRKVAVVITARPSYSRIKSALLEIQKNDTLELQLILSGSSLLESYGKVSRTIKNDGLIAVAEAHNVIEGDSPLAMVKSTGLSMMDLAAHFNQLKPDLVVTVADRYETLATATAAAYMNIPLVHIQGGEVTGSIDEKVRHAITKLSNFHFVSTLKSKERVIKMGEDPETVFCTGCPSIDLAEEVLKNPIMDFDPYQKYGGVGDQPQLNHFEYLVVMQHPVTTEYATSLEQITQTLQAVHQSGLPTLWFWPNIDAGSDGTSKGIRIFREQQKTKNIHFFKNVSPSDFLRMIYFSRGMIGNSSVAIREASHLGVPAINIGTRQNKRERGRNVCDVEYNSDHILAAIESHLIEKNRNSDSLYGDGTAGIKISKLLETIPLKSEKVLFY